VLKEGKITQFALYSYKCYWLTRESKESVCLGAAEKFQFWRAVLTYDQPKTRLCLIFFVKVFCVLSYIFDKICKVMIE
jgi:hypothetical protein